MKASVNNALLHYIDIGISTATPVVLIHGFPFSHRMWTFPGGQTEALASTNRVIAYDVRGHGDSEVGDGQYTIELFVDDLIGLLDHLSIAKTVVVGLSMGGYIALRAIERHPDRFRGLVLCDTKSEGDSNDAKIKRAASIKAVKANGPRQFAQNFVANVFTPDSFNARPEAVKAIQSIIERTAPLSLCGTMLALAARTDTTPALASISYSDADHGRRARRADAAGCVSGDARKDPSIRTPHHSRRRTHEQHREHRGIQQASLGIPSEDCLSENEMKDIFPSLTNSRQQMSSPRAC